MTIEELHSNEELRLREFPVAREKVFLGHAGVCPVPHRVAKAIADYSMLSTLGDQEALLPFFQIQETRDLAARLLGAKSSEVAFVGPTSLALSYIASGLSFSKTDNIVVYFDDYPSNVYPWMALAEKGVQVRMLNTSRWGRIRKVDILGQIDESTRLVALASCHYASGFRIDVDGIGKILRERGILFCLDAIQTVGLFPMSVKYVDFLAADAHKWMLGPSAAGLLYVREEVQDYMQPEIFGWHNVKCPNFIAQEEMELLDDARRYEVGSANLLGLVGLRASMELLEEVGVEAIGREALRKRAWLVPALQEKGWTVLHADAPVENQGGMIAFHREGEDMAKRHAELEKAGFHTSLRGDRAGKNYLRIAPHFYNTDAELKRFLEQL